MSMTAVPISIRLVRAPTAASSGNGDPSCFAKWCTRKYAPSAPSSSAATARSIDCSNASDADRVCEPGEDDQCPNDKKPMFFTCASTRAAGAAFHPGAAPLSDGRGNRVADFGVQGGMSRGFSVTAAALVTLAALGALAGCGSPKPGSGPVSTAPSAPVTASPSAVAATRPPTSAAPSTPAAGPVDVQ